MSWNYHPDQAISLDSIEKEKRIEKMLYPKFKVYKDIDDNGISFTVYNDKGEATGQFLGDDPYLKELRKGGAQFVEGLDNRTSNTNRKYS
jgi:hypothetical protein